MRRRQILLSSLSVVLLVGCGLQGQRLRQQVGGDAKTDMSTSGIRADKTTETDQQQTGLFNFALSGNGLIAYVLSTALAILAWKLWRRVQHMKRAICHVTKVIEEDDARHLKQKIAKAIANDTLHGHLVAAATKRNKTNGSNK